MRVKMYMIIFIRGFVMSFKFLFIVLFLSQMFKKGTWC